MHWLYYLAYFFGGALPANAAPHAVSGLMGKPFQAPFATPPGQELSSSTTNVPWGFFNLAAGYLLLCRVGHFDLRATGDVVATAAGAMLLALGLAHPFGRFNGGRL